MRRPAALPVAAALLLAGPAAAQDQGVARIDSIFRFIAPDTPGCAVGVSQRGNVVATRAWGLADVERRTPLSPNAVFDIGSAQKQFTAAAILLLVQDGRLSLADDIRRHVPELPDYGHKVTVEHLLTHTSGIPDWPGLLPMMEEGTDVWTLITRLRTLNFTPGDEWSYSSSGFEVAKQIVARASGMSFADFTRRRLFEPLGMTSSAYVPDILQASGERALGWVRDGSGWKPFMRLGANRGGGAVVSTVGDLLRWNDALTTGRLGPLVTATLHESARLNNGRKLSYAHALFVSDVPGGPMIWHDGGAAGFSAWLGRFPTHGLSVAVLCNREPVSAGQLAGRVADLFLPPVDPGARPPGPVAAPGVDVSGRAGIFLDEGGGLPLRLAVSNGRLAIVEGPPLVAVSAERFRPPRRILPYRSEDDFELTFRSNDEVELKSMEGQVTRYRRARPWTPTAADLQSVDGRYRNAEVGQVFEILPGPKGLAWRFERAPERTLDYEPVAPDTYIRNVGVMRFRRDAAGKVTGFEYSSSGIRNQLFTRLGNRVAGSAASSPATPATKEPAPAATPSAPAAPAPKLEELVGEYELVQGRSIVVTLEGGRLYGEPTNNPKRALAHVSGTTFSVEGAPNPLTVTFTLGADGKPTALVMRQNGQERTLPRIR